MKHQLAIIIPFYKIDFFEQTLISLKNQTDQRFTVYIGDDASPADLKPIFRQLNNDSWISEKVIYKRFDENLGRLSLVKQWERCIALTKHEEWLWLFSDDDIMEANCIACFYNSLKESNAYYDLYKFNTSIIDKKNEVIGDSLSKPVAPLDNFSLIMGKITGQLSTFVVEYIFSRKIYKEKKGFVDFPLAWGSDDATWAKFSDEKGLGHINCAKVSWRLSGTNISGNLSRDGIKKLKALLCYCNWILHFFKDHKEIKRMQKSLRHFLLSQADTYVSFITPSVFLAIYTKGSQTLDVSLLRLLSFTYYKNKAAIIKKFSRYWVTR